MSRYKKPHEDLSRLLTHEINPPVVTIANASENMRFAASIAGFGLLMKQSEYQGTVSKHIVLVLGENAKMYDPFGYRAEFIALVTNWYE
jgi:Ca-activated chloride channel family protein